MSKTYWKRVVPHNMNHAIQLCKQHALEKKNMSVARIADHLAITTDLLYKWLGNGRIPANHIFAYEQACGINFITQYLAHSQGLLLIEVPSGRKAQNKDLTDLQVFMTEVGALLIKAHDDRSTPQETMDAIKVLMHDLAWHQKNVAKMDAPQEELDLLGDNNA